MLAAASRSVFLLATTLFALNANAATFVFEGATIFGVRDVEVGGLFYDVDFVDGTCIDLFSGCDDVSDFPFNGSWDERDPRSAVAAALALQAVFNPPGIGIVGRAAGCDRRANCQIMTPTLFDGRASQASVFFPSPRPIGTAPFLQFIDPADDLSQDAFEVYARWTPVPEPSAAVLLGLGLCGLCSATAKRTQS